MYTGPQRRQAREAQVPVGWDAGEGCMEALRFELVLGEGEEVRFAERTEDTSGKRGASYRRSREESC